MKIAVSGEGFGRALPSTLNISINNCRPVSDKGRAKVKILDVHALRRFDVRKANFS